MLFAFFWSLGYLNLVAHAGTGFSRSYITYSSRLRLLKHLSTSSSTMERMRVELVLLTEQFGVMVATVREDLVTHYEL